MKSLEHHVEEFYGPEGETDLPILVITEGRETEDARRIVMPPGYRGIDQASIRDTVVELGRNLEITRYGKHSYENTFARTDDVSKDGMAHVATLHSALTINSGQAWEQSLRHLALGSDLQLYDGSPGSGGSSFFKDVGDIRYIMQHGRFIRDTANGPEAVVLIRDLAKVLTARAEANIAFLTADDPYGIGIAVALAVELKKQGHDIKGLFLNKPPKLYLPEHYQLDESKMSLRGLIKTGKELKSGNQELDASSPDPHRFNREKHGKLSKQWLTSGYLQTHHKATGLPATHAHNAGTFVPKLFLDRRYIQMQAQHQGEGLIRDLETLRAISPETDVSFVVPMPPENEFVVSAIQQSMRKASRRIAAQQEGGAQTRVYMVPGVSAKYPETYLHAMWLGMMRDALRLEKS